eukprot:1214661-Amphidinium_carterae.1
MSFQIGSASKGRASAAYRQYPCKHYTFQNLRLPNMDCLHMTIHWLLAFIERNIHDRKSVETLPFLRLGIIEFSQKVS